MFIEKSSSYPHLIAVGKLFYYASFLYVAFTMESS